MTIKKKCVLFLIIAAICFIAAAVLIYNFGALVPFCLCIFIGLVFTNIGIVFLTKDALGKSSVLLSIFVTLAGLIIVFGIFLTVLSVGDAPSYITSLDKYYSEQQKHLSLPEVNTDEFKGYKDIQFLYKSNFTVISDEQWYRMVMLYDEKSFLKQVKRIDSEYKFVSAEDKDNVGGHSPDFTYNGYEFRTVCEDYPHQITFIGLDKVNHRICYIYFEDRELDSTDDFPQFFEKKRLAE